MKVTVIGESGFFRGKLAQEALVQASGTPFTILRSTQFFEFARGLRSPSVMGRRYEFPLDWCVEVAGPEAMTLEEFVRRFLTATRDVRTVTADPKARYFGAVMDDRTLMPDADARIASTRFADWMASAEPVRHSGGSGRDRD